MLSSDELYQNVSNLLVEADEALDRTTIDPLEVSEILSTLVESFRELDDWLSTDKPLPGPWKRSVVK